ncbi:MAG TPA: hypothetical protein VI432_00090 [Candidatus Paceibacterota bacterium]
MTELEEKIYKDLENQYFSDEKSKICNVCPQCKAIKMFASCNHGDDWPRYTDTEKIEVFPGDIVWSEDEYNYNSFTPYYEKGKGRVYSYQ